jgi:hypothetical protein
MAQKSGAAFHRGDPGPYCPRRIMAHMLRVPAFQFDNPVALFVLPKADDPSIHFEL